MSYSTARSPNLIPRSTSPYQNPGVRAPSPNRAYANPNVVRSPSPNPYGRSSSPNPYGRSSSPNPYGRSSSPNPYGARAPSPYGNPNLSRSPAESAYRKPEGFEIERGAGGHHHHSRPYDPDSDAARALQTSVDHLLLFKARPNAVSGSIPVNGITLFYRSKVSPSLGSSSMGDDVLIISFRVAIPTRLISL
jgi:hypothetical protein